MLQRLWYLLREPKDKQYTEEKKKKKRKKKHTHTQTKQNKNDGDVWNKTVQKLSKFYARVQEIHQPDRQKQHSNLGQSNTLPIMCIFPRQRCRFVYFELVGIQQSIRYLPHTDKLIC